MDISTAEQTFIPENGPEAEKFWRSAMFLAVGPPNQVGSIVLAGLPRIQHNGSLYVRHVLVTVVK